MIKDGFDGIYLDWVEAFENEYIKSAAREQGIDPAVAMIKFIREMKDYAKGRKPEFIIIQQNTASLCEGNPELFNVIDATSQEAVWYDGDATDRWYDRDGYDIENDPELIDYYIKFLYQFKTAGIPVFVCEYARICRGYLRKILQKRVYTLLYKKILE